MIADKDMETYTLLRDYMDTVVTLGNLLRPSGEVLCQTLELAWDDNEPEVSCIPPGIYKCVKHDSARHPDTWEVTGVPDRSEILIHAGNTINDTNGCILVGNAFGRIDGDSAVLNSKETIKMLRKTLPDEFMLDVQE